MIDMNISEVNLLSIYLKDWKMQKMVMSPKSNGTLYPMDQIPLDKVKLSTFNWFGYIRPLNKEDIFNWKGKKTDEALCKTEHKVISGPRREIVNMKQLWECSMYKNRVDSIINISIWTNGKRN